MFGDKDRKSDSTSLFLTLFQGTVKAPVTARTSPAQEPPALRAVGLRNAPAGAVRAEVLPIGAACDPCLYPAFSFVLALRSHPGRQRPEFALKALVGTGAPPSPEGAHTAACAGQTRGALDGGLSLPSARAAG